ERVVRLFNDMRDPSKNLEGLGIARLVKRGWTVNPVDWNIHALVDQGRGLTGASRTRLIHQVLWNAEGKTGEHFQDALEHYLREPAETSQTLDVRLAELSFLEDIWGNLPQPRASVGPLLTERLHGDVLACLGQRLAESWPGSETA